MEGLAVAGGVEQCGQLGRTAAECVALILRHVIRS
jgi:hypothetical protein